MNFADLRLRIGRFFRSYKKMILIGSLIWVVIFMINMLLKNRAPSLEPETSYEPNVSVMSTSSTVPTILHEDFEEIIDKYVGLCNDGEFGVAFNMLADECKESTFDNDLKMYMSYLLSIMPTQKQHSIQSYSNTTLNGRKAYIYQVKYFDDILATGLSGTEYKYTEEKITFIEEKGGKYNMYVGNYMYHSDVKRITENEYLKVDVIEKDVYYSMEKYKVKLTNRSDYTIVLADNTETEEIALVLSGEDRDRQQTDDVVLAPNESREIILTFFKYVDDGDESTLLAFENVRVMEKYSGTEGVDEAIIESEKNNAIAKFSVNVVLN